MRRWHGGNGPFCWAESGASVGHSKKAQQVTCSQEMPAGDTSEPCWHRARGQVLQHRGLKDHGPLRDGDPRGSGHSVTDARWW